MLPPCWIAALALGALSLPGAESRFDLRGNLEPPRERVLLILDGSNAPFTASVFSDARGRFRFRGLAPGPYTLRTFVPGMDEVRRTVEVSASLADKNRVVAIIVPFDPSGPNRDGRQRQHAVSARELSIPDSAKREYKEALALLGRNDVAAAVKRLERAVELAPQFVEAWNNLGTIAYQTARYGDAERYFRTGLEHEPGSFSPAVNLGGVLVTTGRYEEALEYNLYCVQQAPGDALANVQLGMNYFHLGKLDSALKYLREAKRLDPNHFSYPQIYLARIYLQRGDDKAGSAELEDFVKRHPDAAQAVEIRKLLEGKPDR